MTGKLFDLNRSRKEPRKTFWPLDAPKMGMQLEIEERQLYAARDSEQVTEYHREVMARKVQENVEAEGYTTHLSIIKNHGAWDLHRDPARFGVVLRVQFPPRGPVPGDGLEFENGKYAGSWGTVPDSIRVDTGVTFRDPIPTTYEPAGFNTATGNWVYRTI